MPRTRSRSRNNRKVRGGADATTTAFDPINSSGMGPRAEVMGTGGPRRAAPESVTLSTTSRGGSLDRDKSRQLEVSQGRDNAYPENVEQGSLVGVGGRRRRGLSKTGRKKVSRCLKKAKKSKAPRRETKKCMKLKKRLSKRR